ncbi:MULTISPECIES: hypothetical protein [Chromobacterium]|uniref:hypothetical protein n=1 Tax=Chromobacterium TaxID=535 RepID=UPI001886FFAA|nr:MULTISPECIES: hypothetical protein [Chromobacterium]WON83108.1 hypothetical protein OK026_18480 [Chromobacterium haemolyticum]
MWHEEILLDDIVAELAGEPIPEYGNGLKGVAYLKLRAKGAQVLASLILQGNAPQFYMGDYANAKAIEPEALRKNVLNRYVQNADTESRTLCSWISHVANQSYRIPFNLYSHVQLPIGFRTAQFNKQLVRYWPHHKSCNDAGSQTLRDVLARERLRKMEFPLWKQWQRRGLPFPSLIDNYAVGITQSPFPLAWCFKDEWDRLKPEKRSSQVDDIIDHERPEEPAIQRVENSRVGWRKTVADLFPHAPTLLHMGKPKDLLKWMSEHSENDSLKPYDGRCDKFSWTTNEGKTKAVSIRTLSNFLSELRQSAPPGRTSHG